MGYIAAFDIGIASVGWAVIDKEMEKVVEAGSNIFPEATAAKNQTRRTMRQARRLMRRERTRLDDFDKLWGRYGFTIPHGNENNIVELKVKALSGVLPFDELYRILHHYLKYRGISYLEDAEDDGNSSASAYENGINRNREELKSKFPCEIQKERLEKNGKYRGLTRTAGEDGEKLDLLNVFTIGAYEKEIRKIFEVQKAVHKELTDDFCNEYLEIFRRKRKYYEGPGSEKSRTDYGIYTTRIAENGDYINEENIFAKLIGKCSVYENRLRAAKATYTAQEFNLLNDLNNLTVNGRKLLEDEKRKIIDRVKISDRVNIPAIIAKEIGEKIETLSGARLDKDGKEDFHKFETYNAMRKALAEINVAISTFSREELDEIGRILTINTDKESQLNDFKHSLPGLPDEVKERLIRLRKEKGDKFRSWHSFSLEIMNELIPDMYEQPKEQMTLLTEKGLFTGKDEKFKGLRYIPVDAASEELFNPVVRRAVRISFRILNALLQKYGSFDEVVIEMPRDKNTADEQKRIADENKKNRKEMEFIESQLVSGYGIRLTSADYASQKQLTLKLKLWNEQSGKCLYSGRTIDPRDIIAHPERFEIDHIIPRSISFDDSRNNKVLVYKTENQKKGNQTPYYYLNHAQGNWSFEKYKATVMELSKKKEYGISKKKVRNLLFSEDITKMDVLKGFINRNITDTGYIARTVLNTLQSFFRANNSDTNVKVINGSYTHQMRVNMKLEKNRDDDFSHHAVDAMLIGFSKLGYDAYRKLQGTFIDFETGEILDKKMWDSNMSDDVYKDYLYGRKWSNIRSEITRAAKDVKYWHFVDRKSNRVLCNQTIRGTREYGGKNYKINKLNIRTKDGVELFKKLALSVKESDRERLLVYKNDRRTFDDLVQILNDYSDVENPFTQYEAETGDFVRKYAKKHNGPRIETLKYTNGEVGACIDISHKYGHDKDSRKVILEKLVHYRMDVYYNNSDKLYYLVGIEQSDVKCENGIYVINEDAYAKTLVNEKMIQPGQTRKDLEQLGYEFRLSFYENDIIEYEKNGEIFRERFLSRTMPQKRNYIQTKPIHKECFDGKKQNLIGIAKTTRIIKYRMDILGNYYPCEKEKFSRYC